MNGPSFELSSGQIRSSVAEPLMPRRDGTISWASAFYGGNDIITSLDDHQTRRVRSQIYVITLPVVKFLVR